MKERLDASRNWINKAISADDKKLRQFIVFRIAHEGRCNYLTQFLDIQSKKDPIPEILYERIFRVSSQYLFDKDFYDPLLPDSLKHTPIMWLRKNIPGLDTILTTYLPADYYTPGIIRRTFDSYIDYLRRYAPTSCQQIQFCFSGPNEFYIEGALRELKDATLLKFSGDDGSAYVVLDAKGKLKHLIIDGGSEADFEKMQGIFDKLT